MWCDCCISCSVRNPVTRYPALPRLRLSVKPNDEPAERDVCGMAPGIVHLWSATRVLLRNLRLRGSGALVGTGYMAEPLSGPSTFCAGQAWGVLRCAGCPVHLDWSGV